MQFASAQNKKVLFVIADGIPASELEKEPSLNLVPL